MTAQTVERKAIAFACFNNAYLPKKFVEEFDNKQVPYTIGYGEFGINRPIPLEIETKVPAFAKLVGVDFNNPNWTERVEDFLAEWEIKIPLGEMKGSKVDGGMILDGGYRQDENGIIHPNDINAYIALNLMSQDGEVGKDVDSYKYKSQYKFFCLDVTKQKAEEIASIENEKKNYQRTAKLLSAKDNDDQLKFILQVYNKEVSPIEISGYTRIQLEDGIIELSKKNPKAIAEATSEGFELAQKAFLTELVHSGAVQQQGNAYFFKSQLLANDDEQMIIWLKNPANSGDIAKMQAIILNYKATNVNRTGNTL